MALWPGMMVGVLMVACSVAPSAPPVPVATQEATPPRIACDFNGDGFADLAVGAPDARVGTKEAVGTVTIIPGSASGPTAAGSQRWHQDSKGVRGTARTGDQFGATLAAGDFNGDGFSDLAVGIPLARFHGKKAGAVQVLYGSPRGLTAAGDQFWHQGSSGVPGTDQRYDRFGNALAAGDFDADGFADLAIGAPEDKVPSGLRAGRVVVLRGSRSGLVGKGLQSWHQASRGVVGTPEQFDSFGSYLAAGDFNADGRADLAITAEGESVTTGGGAVHVLPGSASGLTATGSQFLTADTLGLPLRAGLGIEGLGALAAADFNADGRADLAIGQPTNMGVPSGGSVVTLISQPDGFHPDQAQRWNLERADLPGVSEENDRFGQSLAAGDLTGDGFADLAIGAMLKPIAGHSQVGAVYLLVGSPSGPQATPLMLTQGTPGIPGEVQDWTDFGEALTALPLSGGIAWLAVGAPGDPVGTHSGAGTVTVLPGSPSGPVATSAVMFTSGVSGIPGSVRYARFGTALAR